MHWRADRPIRVVDGRDQILHERVLDPFVGHRRVAPLGIVVRITEAAIRHHQDDGRDVPDLISASAVWFALAPSTQSLSPLFSLPNLALEREWRWFGRTTRWLATVRRPITSITTRCPVRRRLTWSVPGLIKRGLIGVEATVGRPGHLRRGWRRGRRWRFCDRCSTRRRRWWFGFHPRRHRRRWRLGNGCLDR